jgi:hypothetical protein
MVHPTRPTRAWLVLEPRQSTLFVPAAPTDHCLWRVTPTLAAIAVFDTPSAASNTIRARCARPARTLELLVSDTSRSRSPSRKPNAAAARFAMPHPCRDQYVQRLMTRSTRPLTAGFRLLSASAVSQW